MVSSACDRDKRPAAGQRQRKADFNVLPGGGRELVIHGLGGYIGGRTFQERNKPRHDRPFANVPSAAGPAGIPTRRCD